MERREISYTVGGNVNWYSPYGEQYRGSKHRAIIRPCNSTPGHTSREKHILKGYMHLNVHCSTVYNSQDMEATLMSIDGGMDKEDVCVCVCVCVYRMEYCSAIKENEIMPFEAT